MTLLLAALIHLTGFDGRCGTTAEPKVIYGEDNRLEYYQVTDETLRLLSQSTAVMVNKTDLTANGNGFDIDTSDTLAKQSVCADEPFVDQPTPGYCSAFLVAPNLIVTAGHCVSNLSLRAVVFGFRMNGTGDLVSYFSQDDVYYPTQVLASSTGISDWAVIRLDRAVVGRDPLPFRTTGSIPDLQNVVVIGYPIGLPLKVASGAYVRENTNPSYFVANTDTYGGNSGSAIINLDTYVVEGVLVRGETDFETDPELHCKRSKVCADAGCSGEDCTRTTEWAQLVLNYSEPTPTPTRTATPTLTSTLTASPTPTDDHGDTPATATSLVVNDLASGRIEEGGDADFFVFEGAQGSLYSIETYAGTLLDTFIELYAADGTTLVGFDDNEGVGEASQVIWNASANGSLYVKVTSPNAAATGTYQIRVSGPCEDDKNSGYLETDLNHDGKVNAEDLLRFIEDFGTAYPTPTPVSSR